MIYLIPLFCLSMLTAWIMAEFKAGRRTRMSLGLISWGSCFLIAAFVGGLERLNSNVYYGKAAEDLIEATIECLNSGDTNRALKVFHAFKSQYHPTYENRANFQAIAKEAARQLASPDPIPPGSTWDGTPFNHTSWKGHWEDDSDFWLLISYASSFEVLRSGDPPIRMHDVAISHDFRVLKFKEGSSWQHSLTLTNQHEASHEWVDLEKQSVWRTGKLHKLVRASATLKSSPAN